MACRHIGVDDPRAVFGTVYSRRIMRESETIRSRANPLLKRVGAVLAGKEEETIVLEGDRLVDDAIGARHAIEVVLVADDRADRAAALERRDLRVQIVAASLMARVSSLERSPGILALARK